MVNYSNKFKYVWWGIGACGSGTMSTILKDEFDLNSDSSRNTQGVPKGKEDYTLIVNVRNPYCWEISSYLDLVKGPEKKWQDGMFEQYLEEGGNDAILLQLEVWEDKLPDYFIRCEDMYSELQKIPILANHEPSGGWESVKKTITNPTYKRTREPITKEILSSYWNKDLIEMYSERYKRLFEITGYNLDSWKTGIHWDGWELLK